MLYHFTPLLEAEYITPSKINQFEISLKNGSSNCQMIYRDSLLKNSLDETRTKFPNSSKKL
jgi:hypothetical protein